MEHPTPLTYEAMFSWTFYPFGWNNGISCSSSTSFTWSHDSVFWWSWHLDQGYLERWKYSGQSWIWFQSRVSQNSLTGTLNAYFNSFKTWSFTQWPGYDSLDITINSNTKQELAVALCTALHKFYSLASVGDTLKNRFSARIDRIRRKYSLRSNLSLGPSFHESTWEISCSSLYIGTLVYGFRSFMYSGSRSVVGFVESNSRL